MHVELSGTRDWRASAHLIVEVPPGEAYCDARKAIWQLVKDDAHTDHPSNTHIFTSPPKIQVVGLVFFDQSLLHGDGGNCMRDGGRGIEDRAHPKMVEGLWELHPVIAVKDAVTVQ